MVTVDGREQIRGALDEADERAHREGDAARRKVATDPIERREQRELLVDEPGQPVAGDLGAFVRRGQRARRRSLAAVAAAAGRAPHDAAALVLLDDVQLLLGDDVGDVERATATVGARVGASIVLLGLEVRRQRLAT